MGLLGQCLGCSCENHKTTEFIGPKTAKLAIVGEYPGAKEVERKIPFCGPAGELLDMILGYLHLERNAIRLGNAILCGPITDEDKAQPWWPEVVQRCGTRMEAENDLGEAKVVVTLGGTGAWSLLGRPVVLGGRYPVRGAVHHARGGRIVIPTWNPAAILRAGGSGGEGRNALSDADAETLGLDILRGWKLAHGEIQEFKPTLLMESDPKVFARWCNQCDWRVSIDVETSSADPMSCKLLSVGLARRSTSVLLPPAPGEDGVPALRTADAVSAISFWWPNADDEAKQALRDLLANGLVDSTFHNASYDEIVLSRLVGPVIGPISDTLLLSHARFPDVRVDLADVAQTWLAVEPWKHKFHSKDGKYEADVEDAQEKGYDVATWNEERVMALLEYNAMDVAATAAIEPMLVAECEREHVLEVAAIDVALARVATQMTKTGVPLDQEVKKQLKRETQARVEASKDRMWRLVEEGIAHPADPAAAAKLVAEMKRKGGKFNPNSDVMLECAFDACGVKVPASKYALTAKGKRSFGKLALAEISDVPLVAAMAEHRGTSRMVSVYFDDGSLPVGDDGRLHMPWKIHGTPTGRWASGKEDEDDDVVSVNLQNWPHSMRKMVVALPGTSLVGIDFAQLEYRVIALLAGEDSLLALFNDPARPDLHSTNAGRLFGSDWEAVDPAKFENPFEQEKAKRKRKILRGLTKNGLYGALYLGSAEKIQKTLQARSLKESDSEFAEAMRRVSKKQCQEFVTAVPRMWPKIEEWRKWAVRDAEENCQIVCPLSGRRRVWPLGMVDGTQCVNTRVQMMAGSLMNTRFLYLSTALPPEAKIILQVHDSVVVECPEEMAEQVKQIMVDTMTTDLTLNGKTCLFTVDAEIGRTWAEV